MPEAPPKSEAIAASVTARTHRVVKELAARRRETMSQFVRRTIRREIQQILEDLPPETAETTEVTT